MSTDFRIAYYFYFHLGVSLSLQAVIQVDDKPGFGVFGKSIAMDCSSFGG